MKQAALASLLGVSQPTIARWESGQDTPSSARMAQVRNIMASTLRDELAIERMLIERQANVRTLMDIDGMKLRAVSMGYRQLWPEFSSLIGVSLADNFVNESRLLLDDEDLMRRIRLGSVGLISGVSDRHFKCEMDAAIRHRWHMCFRRYGTVLYADISFDPCDDVEEIGIYDQVNFDDFGESIAVF